MHEIIRVIFSVVMLAYSSELGYRLYKKIKGKGYGVIWISSSMALSLFLAIFSYYLFLRRAALLGSDVLIRLLYMYLFAGVFVLFVLRFSMNTVIKVKRGEAFMIAQQRRYEKENIELQRDSQAIAKNLAKKVTELEQARTAMINILEDVTTQKDELKLSKKSMEKLNWELARTNRELLALDKQKDQFTSITAHELKTPLTSIHGFVQLLQDPKIFEDKEKRTKYTQIILQDTERLSSLITDILDISRMDLGTLKFFFDNVYTEEVMKNVYKEMSSIARKKNIELTYKIKKNVPKTMYTDKNRLTQVLTNLINNAIHYTHENGKIEFKVDKVAGHLIFHIKDSGIGIPKVQQKKIFERFYQVDSWLTRKIGGSGLGLAICKGIVNALGGKIWVTSKPGKGTTFHFTTPISADIKEEEREKWVKVFETKRKEKAMPLHKKREEKVKPKIVSKKPRHKPKEKTIEKKVADFFE